MMIIDSHNHSEFSIDAEYTVLEMAKAAAKMGIEVFAITDHCDVDDYEKNNLAVSVPSSIHAIEVARASLPIKLLTGVELGQSLQNIQKADYVLNNYNLDYVIGSIHVTKGEKDFYWMDYESMIDSEIEAALEKYYNEVYELAKWNKFDSLAHITYPYRYIINAKAKRDININADKFDEIAAEVFKLIIKNGKAIENNSSSFTKSKEDYALNYKYLKMYFDLGGEFVTTGSDAHTPNIVGNGILEGYEMLKEIGFQSVTYFEKRKPIQVSI
ncbi:MAG: histidinol-phosphatase HisJ family protein [Oscillospiraceae bacterium]